jgi:hypothetical protein
MMHQDRVHTLRHTHNTMTTLMPLITAGLTVTGALIAAFETRNASTPAAADRDDRHEPDARPAEADEAFEAAGAARAHTVAYSRARSSRPVSVRRYIATLAGRLLLVLLGVALVLAITIAATSTGRVGEAITITALILLTLYLVEKVARRA